MTKTKSKKPSLKSQGVRLTAYVPQQVKDDVDMLAIVQKTTSSELVLEALQKFLKSMKKDK
jgi:hypothetical protein